MEKNYNFEEGYINIISIIDKKLENKANIVINIGGATASGKTTLSKKINKKYIDKCIIISMDDYYKGRGFIEDEVSNGREYSFDHIEAINTDLIIENLKDIQSGKEIKKPIYCMKAQAPIGIEKIKSKRIIIIEGIYALHDSISKIDFDLSIFVDSPTETRLERRLKRDLERTNDSPETTKKFFQIAEKMYQREVVNNMKNAHIIINN